MCISAHKSRSMFDRYDITDERNIQIAGRKLARDWDAKSEEVTKEVTKAKIVFIAKSREVQLLKLAPQVGFEPTTLRLTAECSTVELLRNRGWQQHYTIVRTPVSIRLVQRGSSKITTGKTKV